MKFCRNPKKAGRFCYVCGKEDHLANQCRLRPSFQRNANSNHMDPRRTQEGTDAPQFSSTPNNHESLWSYHRTWTTHATAKQLTQPANYVISFCLDSSSTNHCCGNKQLFSNLRELASFTFVNSFGVKDTGKLCGDIRGVLENGQKVHFRDVLYSTKLKANLISVNQLAKSRLQLILRKLQLLFAANKVNRSTKLTLMEVSTK